MEESRRRAHRRVAAPHGRGRRSSRRTQTLTDKQVVGRPAVLQQGGAEVPETYPEYDVESEDEILDAAAHFLRFKILPWHHPAGFSSARRNRLRASATIPCEARRSAAVSACLGACSSASPTSDGTSKWTRRAASAPPPSRHRPRANFQQMDGEGGKQKLGRTNADAPPSGSLLRLLLERHVR